MPIANAGYGSIHYQIEGKPNAPVLMFSNSLGATLNMWDVQAQTLAERFRILRYDTRGHGRSSVPPDPYSLTELAGDVLDLLDVLGIDRVHFCGISLGGITALWLAIHAPQRIRSIVASNTAARIGTPDAWNARIQQITAEGMAPFADATMQRWFTSRFRERHPQQVSPIRQAFCSIDPAGYIGCCAALRDADLTSAIASITRPTLVIAGTHDPTITIDDVHFLEHHIHGASFRELNAAHISNIEDAANFSAALVDFVDSES